MFIGQPKFGLPKLPRKLFFKFLLGGFFLTFLMGYQPTLNYPPLRQNIASAQSPSLQETSITADVLPITFQLPFPGYVSQKYYNYHPAVDIATGLGMPIKPIATGKVTSAGYDFFGYGLKVEIDHGNGYKSLYAHMGKLYVKEGDEITDLNSYIGEVGLTGKTTGPHTHLEVTKDGNTIDAQAILPEIRQYAVKEDFQPVGAKGFDVPKKQEPVASSLPSPQPKKENTFNKLDSYLSISSITETKEEPKKLDILNDLKLKP